MRVCRGVNERWADVDTETIGLVLSNRSFLWNLVARGFAEEPDQAFLDIVLSEHAKQEVALLDDGFAADMLAALDSMASFASGESALPQLRDEYVRFFVGPEELAVAPWESVARSGSKALFSCGVLQVREAYREAGFLPANYPHVADDFIGIECDFMAKLALLMCSDSQAAEWESLRRHIGQSLEFAENHLSVWLPMLASSMHEAYGSCFYASLCDFANSVVRRDGAVLRSLREALR